MNDTPRHCPCGFTDDTKHHICPITFARIEREIATLRAENSARLAELHAISEALGTNEGHSAVDHILALKSEQDALRVDEERYNMLFLDTWKDGSGLAIFRYTRSHDDFERIGITEANEWLDAARKA